MYLFFFFKQKTAYEMRISDWSSDVCSSDLHHQDDGDDPCEDGPVDEIAGHGRLLPPLRRSLTGLVTSLLGRHRLDCDAGPQHLRTIHDYLLPRLQPAGDEPAGSDRARRGDLEIGRASCGERACQYV